VFGVGSGSIPAGAVAIGKSMEDLVATLSSMKGQALRTKSATKCNGCVKVSTDVVSGFTSAFFGKSTPVDFAHIDRVKLYDALDHSKDCGKPLISLFGTATFMDLLTGLELIYAPGIPLPTDIMSAVLGSIEARDKDAREALASWKISEVLTAANNFVDAASGGSLLAGKNIRGINFFSRGPSGEVCENSFSKFLNTVYESNTLERNLIVVHVVGEIIQGPVPIPLFNYEITKTSSEKHFITITFKIGIPRDLALGSSTQKKQLYETIDSAVAGFFPNPDTSRRYVAQSCTDLLVHALANCLTRAIDYTDSLRSES
jgi:hypothetical protein